jgi:hypothetical protein
MKVIYKNVFNILLDGDQRDISSSQVIDGIRILANSLLRKNLLFTPTFFKRNDKGNIFSKKL